MCNRTENFSFFFNQEGGEIEPNTWQLFISHMLFINKQCRKNNLFSFESFCRKKRKTSKVLNNFFKKSHVLGQLSFYTQLLIFSFLIFFMTKHCDWMTYWVCAQVANIDSAENVTIKMKSVN